MPTTKLKNNIYRMMLPFFAPPCSRHPLKPVIGRNINNPHALVSLLRRHHVQGAALLLSDQEQKSIICSESALPGHEACISTYFRVASITKTATAVLAMRFAEEKIFELEKPVRSFFPSLPYDRTLDDITLKHLLSHTSGLIDPPCLESSLEKGVPFTDLLHDAQLFKPGDSFHYSNLGYGLIGSIMESVTDKPVGQIFRQYLFEPLQMNATLEGCLLPRDKIMPVTRVLPYHKDHDLILTPLGSSPLSSPDPYHHYGHTAGSMYTDILSLQKLFDILRMNHSRFLSGASVNAMKHKYASYGKISPALSYGFGLLRINDPYISDSLVLGHQGFAYGCADGAFWEEKTGRMMIMLNGGASEARNGRLGCLNRDLLHWAFREEIPSW